MCMTMNSVVSKHEALLTYHRQIYDEGRFYVMTNRDQFAKCMCVKCADNTTDVTPLMISEHLWVGTWRQACNMFTL